MNGTMPAAGPRQAFRRRQRAGNSGSTSTAAAKYSRDMKFAQIAIGALLTFQSACLAENWPGFRGPTGQGVSAEAAAPLKWSPRENIAFKVAVPGEGWSSPIVWGDTVYLTTTLERGSRCHVLALDAASGAVKWDVEAFTQIPTKKEKRNSYATPTPLADETGVYAFFGSGGAVAINPAGKVIWSNVENHFYSQHGLGASPILYKDLLIMPWDHSIEKGPELRIGWQIPWDKSFVLALDKATGKLRYRAQRGMSRISHMTPRIVQVDGRPQLISAAGDVIEAFDPESGRKIWWVRAGGEGTTPSPVFGDGVVYASSGFPTPIGNQSFTPAVRAFKLGGEGDMSRQNLIWEQKKAPPMLASPLLHDGLLYTIKEDGQLQALDARDGQVVYRQKLQGSYSASPVLAAGRIYLTSDDGLTTVIEPGRQFRELAQNPLEEKMQASLAVSGGRIYIRTENHLYGIGQK